MNDLVIRSYAKINLFLSVLNKRPDNYHNIDSLFQRISLADKIILKNRQDTLIKVSCNNPRVPLDSSNLCFKAAELLRNKFGIKKGLDIQIIKHIPAGAGLGGGSSNAAAVLTGLNKLWRLRLSKIKLARIAAKIGSDVPFFIYDAPFAQVSGRGEKIRALKELRKIKLRLVLVVPKIHVSTPLIYRHFDQLCGLTPTPIGKKPLRKQLVWGLTKPVANAKILTLALVKKDFLFKPGLLFNSLEQVTLKLYPEVRRVKRALSALGLEANLMSGSGAAVFAILPSGKRSALAIKKIKREQAWQVYAAHTV